MMIDDIAEQLRDKAFKKCGPTMEAVHTRLIEWKAADALEAQARRIAELVDYNLHLQSPVVMQDMLIEKLRARIAELEALLSQTNEGYAECIAEREDWREKAKQAEIDIDAADEWAKGFIEKTDARIAELEAALDAFHKDPENPDAAVLRYKAIASKAINEQVEIRKEYEARISELKEALNTIETHLLGLVRIHSRFATEADGTWSGKKQKVRAGECSKILAFTRKTIKALEKIND